MHIIYIKNNDKIRLANASSSINDRYINTKNLSMFCSEGFYFDKKKYRKNSLYKREKEESVTLEQKNLIFVILY